MKTKSILFQMTGIVLIAFMLSSCTQNNNYYTRGVGIYPGNPKEDFSPELVKGDNNYRNLALMRPAFHSSSYDYNLTAQLVTDGIITHEAPDFITLGTNDGLTPKNEREWLFDHNRVTVANFTGKDIWIQLGIHKEKTPEITRINLNGSLEFSGKPYGGWQFTCFGSDDGLTWNEIGKNEGNGLPGEERPNRFAAISARPKGKKTANPFTNFFAGPYGSDSTAPKPSSSFKFSVPKTQRIINQTFEFKQPVSYHFYRLAMSTNCAESWRFGELSFYSGDDKLKMAPSNSLGSAWMSEGAKDEWVYVDLGTPCRFDKIQLFWVNKAEKGSVEVSDDAKIWTLVDSLSGNDASIDTISLKRPANGRYVRIFMKSPKSGNNFILSEVEVYGKGGLVPKPKPGPSISDNTMNLSGGNWKIERSSEVSETGENISKPGFSDKNWIIATVPGTALVSYWNAGALPDPGYADNQLMISESFFNSDFWYRDEFKVPSDFKGERMFLNFDGINWKADIYVNGKKLGQIDGAFIRGVFDVTDLIKPGQNNAVSVLIKKNDNIGVIKQATETDHDKNGGILGADNPTYHASIGWDWIPTIRGRNIGIWNDVRLTTTGAVTIEDPFITTDLNLPDTTTADISVEAVLHNYNTEKVAGKFTLKYGDIIVDRDVILDPSSSKVIKFNPTTNKELHLSNPELWWPKGYG